MIEGRNIGRSLNTAMASHRHYAAARPPYVSQQQLDNPCRTYHLHSGGMLGPSQCINDRAGSLAPRIPAHQLRYAYDVLRTASAGSRHHFGRVVCEMPLEDLKDAARVAKRRIAL